MSVSTPDTNTSFRGAIKKMRSKRNYASVSSLDIDLGRRRRKFKRCRHNSEENTDGKVNSSVAFPAEELQSKFPSFVKYVLKSHVSGGYWMGLPASFSRKHLPQVDSSITLETQSKKPYKAKYLVSKTGLSGGWREFAISEKLMVGDVLTFHLLSATKFKVGIVKKNSLADVEGALYTVNLDSPGEQSNLDMFRRSSKGKHLAENDQRIMQPPDHSENIISPEDSIRCEGRLQMRKSATPIFNAVSTFDDFNSVIKDLLKDFELPQRINLSYYKLCWSQNGLLHVHLLKSMKNIFVGGTIIATVTVANSLRECEFSTSKDEFVIWYKTLNALELLGMNVGFLRARLLCLQRIVHDSEVPTFRAKCAELCSKNTQAKDKIRHLVARLAEMKKVHRKRAAKISNLKSKIENHELKFQEQVQATW